MGISGVTPPPKPRPKALCPGCGRPVAVLKSDRCLYCGAATGRQAATAPQASRLPAEALIALEPRQGKVSTGSKWLRRGLGLGVAGLLITIVVVLCSKG